MFCLLVVLVKLSLLANWLPRRTSLRKPNCGEGIISVKPRPKRAYDCVGLLYSFVVLLGGTGISRLMRGLAILPQDGSRSLQWSETGMKDPQEDPLAVHCFCVCSGSALLGDLLGVSRSTERDLPSVLSIYLRIFFCVFIVYRRVLRILCLLLYSAICWCVLLWFSCQYLPSDWLEKDPFDDTFVRWGDYLHKAQLEERVCVYFSFVWFVYFAMCFPLHDIYFICLWHDIAYMCWKCR